MTQDELAALDRAATQELLADEGHYFADTLCDLASCSHRETAHFNHQGDGPFIAALWNLYRAGRIAVIDDGAVPIARTTTAEAENARLEAENAKLREALKGLIDDEPCWYDHHGYCQAHYVSNPCEMAIARAALETNNG
jgi:hypothetical protein